MFGFGKKAREEKRLKKAWEALMKEAMELQRQGQIPEYAKKMAEADAFLKEHKIEV